MHFMFCNVSCFDRTKSSCADVQRDKNVRENAQNVWREMQSRCRRRQRTVVFRVYRLISRVIFLAVAALYRWPLDVRRQWHRAALLEIHILR